MHGAYRVRYVDPLLCKPDIGNTNIHEKDNKKKEGSRSPVNRRKRPNPFISVGAGDSPPRSTLGLNLNLSTDQRHSGAWSSSPEQTGVK
jgi:hypothetical protein